MDHPPTTHPEPRRTLFGLDLTGISKLFTTLHEQLLSTGGAETHLLDGADTPTTLQFFTQETTRPLLKKPPANLQKLITAQLAKPTTPPSYLFKPGDSLEAALRNFRFYLSQLVTVDTLLFNGPGDALADPFIFHYVREATERFGCHVELHVTPWLLLERAAELLKAPPSPW